MTDPRGPERTITALQPLPSETRATLSCGHVASLVNHFAHKVGYTHRCIRCNWPRYTEGWNDRVASACHGEDYGKVYRTNGGPILASLTRYETWTQEEREHYVKGWEEATARIKALALPESRGC